MPLGVILLLSGFCCYCSFVFFVVVVVAVVLFLNSSIWFYPRFWGCLVSGSWLPKKCWIWVDIIEWALSHIRYCLPTLISFVLPLS